MNPEPSSNLPKPWAIRCAHTSVMPVKELLKKQFPNNPNKHPAVQLDTYIIILEKQGIRKPVVMSRQTDRIITGHGMLLSAERAGQEVLPVDYQDFDSPEMELAHVIADNRLPQLSETDFKTVADAIKGLPKDFNVELTAFKNDEALNLLLANWQPPKLSALDAEQKPKKELKAHPVRFDGHQWERLKPLVQRLRRENPAFQMASDVDCLTYFAMNYQWPGATV